MSLRLRSVLVLLILALCPLTVAIAQSAAPEVETLSLLEEALQVSKELDPNTDLDACRTEMDRIEAAIRKDLDAIRAELRGHGYCPVLFDFEKPTNRDYIETVCTLAHMSRFGSRLPARPYGGN